MFYLTRSRKKNGPTHKTKEEKPKKIPSQTKKICARRPSFVFQSLKEGREKEEKKNKIIFIFLPGFDTQKSVKNHNSRNQLKQFPTMITK